MISTKIKSRCMSVLVMLAMLFSFANVSPAAAKKPSPATATGTWSPTGLMTVYRFSHTATLLANGKVLVAGGDGYSGELASAELYDPVTGTWMATGSMTGARTLHTATLLANGKVLVTGGSNDLYNYSYLTSAELYDPATGVWTITGSMTVARVAHTATLLADGKVLVLGGYSSNANSAELYDPATGAWTTTSSMTGARAAHTATLLADGKVLAAGGEFITSAELYNPVTNTWTATGSIGPGFIWHTATLLTNGKVLVAGGYGARADAELYDPATDAWITTGSMTVDRYGHHTATLLADGKVLVAGGRNSYFSAELYDPATGTWTATDSMGQSFAWHTATRLSNGKVLVAGAGNAVLYSPAVPDTAAPIIALTTPANGAAYLLNQSVIADYACEDEAGGSGLASCDGTVPNGSTIDTTSVGSKTFTVNAADNEGNPSSVTVSYSVAYKFSGFSLPVANAPTLNIANAGRNIPLKFRVTDSNGAPVKNLSSIEVTVTSLECSLGSTPDAPKENTSGNSALKYLGDGYYRFNWKTPKAYALSCKTLILELGDGFEHTALFRFIR